MQTLLVLEKKQRILVRSRRNPTLKCKKKKKSHFRKVKAEIIMVVPKDNSKQRTAV